MQLFTYVISICNLKSSWNCSYRLGFQNSPMEVSAAFLGWKLDVESEKVGGCIGLWRLSKNLPFAENSRCFQGKGRQLK